MNISTNFTTELIQQTYQLNQLNIKIMLSKNIRTLRKKFGYTQAQIANYLGITASAVNQYENDARSIPTDVVSKLSLLFSVEEYDLYQENPQQQQILSAFAFRANEFVEADFKSISEFKKIVLNYFHLSEALSNE